MKKNEKIINNTFYDQLGEAWYHAEDHPIALLRSENRIRSEWVAENISKKFSHPVKILDVGCGAGFLSNHLAEKQHQVVGIDLSTTSLEIAKKYDATKNVSYAYANAYDLPFEKKIFRCGLCNGHFGTCGRSLQIDK